jgi:O-antigen ligase
VVFKQEGQEVITPAVQAGIYRSKKLYAYLSLALCIYVFFLFFIGRFEEFQQFVIWGMGPAFALIVTLSYMSHPFQISKDIIIYFIFWAYCTTGLAVALDPDGFFRYYRLIFSILVLYFCIEVVLVRTGNVSGIFKTFIMITLLHFLTSVVTGELTASAVREENFRFGSLVTNPNGNAYISLTGLMGIIFIWNEHKQKLIRYILAGLGAAFIVTIVLTASRSGFISMCVTFILWPVYCYRDLIRRHLAIYLIAILIIVPALYEINLVLSEDTYLGKRLQHTAESSDIIEDEKRIQIYIEAFEIFLENPMIGVGLSQFMVHSRFQGVAHSDSMELLSTTGIIGFGLIVYLYVIIWRRINKLLRIITDQKIIYRLRFFKVIIIAVATFGLFKPNFLDILTMIKVAVISGYTYYLYYELLKLKRSLELNGKESRPKLQVSN